MPLMTHRGHGHKATFVRVVCAATLLPTIGCQTWQTRPEPPAVVIQDESPDRVRLSSADDDYQIVLANPRVEGDSILGVSERTRRPLTIATSRVDRAEVRGANPAGTVGLVLLAGAAVVGVLTAMVAESLEWEAHRQ